MSFPLPSSAEDIERHAESKLESEKEPTRLHDWNGPDDPDHPQNWALWRKICTTIMLASITFSISINSSMFASATKDVVVEFGVSSEVATLGTSFYLLGFVFGPVFWGPISEKFGRKVPMLTGSGLSALFTLMPALGTNMPIILIGRFLAGAFGASPAAIVSGAATDNWGPVGRGINLTVCVGSIFGAPLLGPVVGNFIIQSASWRWTMRTMVILGLSVTGFCAVALSETYPPMILKARARRLRKSTGDEGIRCKFDDEKTDVRTVCQVYLVRPWVLFFTEPILVLVTIYQAFIYGILYLFISAYPSAFADARGWRPGPSALPLLSLHIGIFCAIGATVAFMLTFFRRRVTSANGIVRPEDRLPMMIGGASLLPVGLLWFAWTAANDKIYWIVPILAGVLIGGAMFSVFIACIAYLIDVYLPVANSAMAANSTVRALFGAGFPLFAVQMYSRLGVAWATSVLALLSLCMVPVPVVFWWKGELIRSWSKNAVVGK